MASLVPGAAAPQRGRGPPDRDRRAAFVEPVCAIQRPGTVRNSVRCAEGSSGHPGRRRGTVNPRNSRDPRRDSRVAHAGKTTTIVLAADADRPAGDRHADRDRACQPEAAHELHAGAESDPVARPGGDRHRMAGRVRRTSSRGRRRGGAAGRPGDRGGQEPAAREPPNALPRHRPLHRRPQPSRGPDHPGLLPPHSGSAQDGRLDQSEPPAPDFPDAGRAGDGVESRSAWRGRVPDHRPAGRVQIGPAPAPLGGPGQGSFASSPSITTWGSTTPWSASTDSPDPGSSPRAEHQASAAGR